MKNQDKYKEGSREARLGDIGEDIVDNDLMNKGHFVCKNIKKGPHVIEGAVFHFDKDPFIYEVKTKPFWAPLNATGFNLHSFRNYEKLNRFGMDVKIFFVDSSTGTMYGNTLDELKKPFKRGNTEFPKIINGRTGEVIIFPMEHMITIRKLTENEMKRLKDVK
jgi:hypothetical protein